MKAPSCLVVEVVGSIEGVWADRMQAANVVEVGAEGLATSSVAAGVDGPLK